MAQVTGESYIKLAVQTFSLGLSITHDSAINSINIALKSGTFSVKICLDYIQTIYEELNISFVTFSRFKNVCQ